MQRMIVRETDCAIQWIEILSTGFERLGPELENDRRTVETLLFFNVNFYSENRLTTM